VEKIRVSSKCGFLAVASVLALAVCFSGCGAVSSSSGTTPPGLSIALSTAPPSTMAPGATATVAATVAHDGANGGVDWSCAPAGSCGSFSPTHTASGATTTYTAPAAGGTVTITVTSTTNHAVVALATITVSSSGALSITIANAPSTLAPGGTATVSATVVNDTANGGVDWTCGPTAGSCGAFNLAHTASGATTTYTAPSTGGNVTIMATSSSNHSVTATANITVSTTPAGALTSGNFAFYLTGVNSNKITYSLAGSVALDANGNVTGGIQDYNSHDGPKSPQPSGDTITGGSLTTASNGKGTLTIKTNNTTVGVNGTETFSVAVVNSKHAVISELDSSASSSGSMDLQSLPAAGLAQVKGPYSFVVSGQASGVLEIFGGTIIADGAGALTTVKINQNKGGTVTSGSNTGTYTAPDGAGRGTVAFGGDHFSYYVVNAKVLRLIVIDEDNTDIGSAYTGVTGVTNASLKAQYVFADSSNLSTGALFAAAGLLTADGNGNITGFADVDENGTASKGTFTGTYSISDTNGFGSMTITPNGNLQDVSVLGLYLTDPSINFSDPNSPADAGLAGLIIDLDPKIPGSGMLIQQGSAITAPSANLALAMQTSNTNNEADAVGEVAISAGGVLTGTVDINDLFKTLSANGQDLAVLLTGTLALDPATPGRFTLPLAVSVGSPALTFNYVLYPASNTQVIVLEIDKPQYGLGTLQRQQ
jgi:hypothetical protein